MRELSRLADSIPASPTIAINDKAKMMRAAGEDVIVLAGGEPDFDTPAHIVEAGLKAIQAGCTRYAAPSKGIPTLLEAIARKMARDNNMEVSAGSEIVVTPGAKWALYLALMSVLNIGDEVLYLEPAWVSYRPMITLIGGTPVPVRLNAAQNFAIVADQLRSHITPKTKALMVNTPCNPTGRVLTRDEAQTIATVAREADLYVIADEIYEKVIFDSREHVSIGSLPGMAERTVTINGLSKAYAMTGWRMGWLVGPAPILKIAAKFNTQTVTSAATFTMHAAAAALEGSQDVVTEMCNAYQARRDFMVQALNDIEGVECQSVEGTFYLFPRFPNSERNSVELAEAILDQAGIAGVPGNAFGSAGEGHVRFSIAASMSELGQAAERLARVAPTL